MMARRSLLGLITGAGAFGLAGFGVDRFSYRYRLGDARRDLLPSAANDNRALRAGQTA